MAKATLTDTSPDDSNGVKWSKLQLWVRKAVDNASIGYVLGGLLNDIDPGADSEGVKFAKLQRWIKLLAANISSGGGGSGWNSSVTDTTSLASLSTVALVPPQIVGWVQTSDLTQQVWILLTSTAANDPTNGVVRPSDYNGSTNTKVWFKTG